MLMIRLAHAKGVAACLTSGRRNIDHGGGISCHYEQTHMGATLSKGEAFCQKGVNDKENYDWHKPKSLRSV